MGRINSRAKDVRRAKIPRSEKAKPPRVKKRRLRNWFHNLSMRNAFMAYILIYLTAGVFAYALFASLTVSAHTDLRESYAVRFTIPPEHGDLYVSLTDVAAYQVTTDGRLLEVLPLDTADRLTLNFIRSAEILGIPVILFGCVGLCSFSFYKRRMKKPLALLRDASQQIEQNNLDFHIEYARKDELGQLCAAFERMRAALLQNERAMWRAMEERKRLNAAFSHDLRTPLTVLRGQTDMLRTFLPSGKITPDKALLTLDTMSAHITRLEGYVTSMSDIQRLEDTEPAPQEIICAALSEQLCLSAEVLCREKGLSFSCECTGPDKLLLLDAALIARVNDNLLSNALRYAGSAVHMECAASDATFLLRISDDGPGFSDIALREATRPFYRGDRRDDTTHFGLGLNICKILCEKHGGNLLLSNGVPCGAQISAFFAAPKQSIKS